MPGWFNLHMIDQDEFGTPKSTIQPQAMPCEQPPFPLLKRQQYTSKFCRLPACNLTDTLRSTPCVRTKAPDTKHCQHCKMYQHPVHSVKDAWTDIRTLRTSQRFPTDMPLDRRRASWLLRKHEYIRFTFHCTSTVCVKTYRHFVNGLFAHFRVPVNIARASRGCIYNLSAAAANSKLSLC